MLTIHKLSAGDGYKYYTQEIASGDMSRSAKQSLGDYYTVDGNPPGLWEGRGAALLNLAGTVNEQQMKALYGEGLRPDADKLIAEGKSVDEVRLGRKMMTFSDKSSEVRTRIDQAFGDFERQNQRKPNAEERRKIRTSVGGEMFRKEHFRDADSGEELRRWIDTHVRGKQQTVSGYDQVFSPAKSVSVLWAVADTETRVKIEKAHTQAIQTAMGYLEDKAGWTRRGAQGVRQERIEGGFVWSRFRHYDSRAGDPQLHDHVVVANRVKGLDGQWSTLDATHLYQHTVSASELYNETIMKNLAESLGIGLVERKVRGDRPVVEIAGVPVEAIEAASSRSQNISPVLDELVRKFTEDHGYAPNKKQRITLAQQATLDTRPAKEHRTLSEMLENWKATLGTIPGVKIGAAALQQARKHRDDGAKAAEENSKLWRVKDASEIDPDQEAAMILERLGRDRNVWGAHHLEAETRRRLGSRFGEKTVPESLHHQVVQAAITSSVALTPGERKPTLNEFLTTEGTSVFVRAGRELFTSREVLGAESSLIEAANTLTLPTASRELFETTLARLSARMGQQGRGFDAGQTAMAREFATGEKQLSVGIGPAGTGKTTTLKLVAETVRAAGGSVFGLAPTAAGAAVMSEEIGAQATTIDMFVGAHQTGAADEALTPRRGDLIIIDEAGMVGTPLFAEAVRIAADHDARIVALGDDSQLSAVGAGGALRLLKQQSGAVHLEDLHRFRNLDDGAVNEAEAAATLALREPPLHGVDDPWGFYRANSRITGGGKDVMIDKVYAAWQNDINAGHDSVMMAFDNATVTALNQRAQAYRASMGELGGVDSSDLTAPLRDGLTARIGDRVVTRENNRRITVHGGKDFVKNNDSWTVTGIDKDGSLTVQHLKHQGVVKLTPKYVQRHTMLGYAATIHRTQGIPCDTAHAVFTSSMSRALAYVATSRGKFSNKIYVGLSEGERVPDVLDAIAANHDGNLTAHEMIVAARAEQRSLPEKVAAYSEIADQASKNRFTAMAKAELGSAITDLTKEPGWAGVVKELAAAERSGINPAVVLAAAARPILQPKAGQEIDDPAGLLRWRVETITTRWAAERDQDDHRPLANITDAHLEKLARTTGTRLVDASRAKAAWANPAAPQSLLQKTLTMWKRRSTSLAKHGTQAWFERMHGHLTDEDLTGRLQQAMMKESRLAQTDKPARKKQQWLISSLVEEKATRVRMPAELRAEEAHQRGAHTNYRKEAGAQLGQAYGAISDRINAEHIHRARYLDQPATMRKDGTAPDWLLSPVPRKGTPGLWYDELAHRRDEISTELTRHGAQLAASQPPWAAHLGPVPSDPIQQARWETLAAAIDTYRQVHRVPVEEPLPVPAKDDTETAQRIRAEVTAMHKYTAQTTKPALTAEQLATHAAAADVLHRATETPTAGEEAVHELRARRAAQNPLPQRQAQEHAQEEQARKLRAETVDAPATPTAEAAEAPKPESTPAGAPAADDQPTVEEATMKQTPTATMEEPATEPAPAKPTAEEFDALSPAEKLAAIRQNMNEHVELTSPAATVDDGARRALLERLEQRERQRLADQEAQAPAGRTLDPAAFAKLNRAEQQEYLREQTEILKRAAAQAKQKPAPADPDQPARAPKNSPTDYGPDRKGPGIRR